MKIRLRDPLTLMLFRFGKKLDEIAHKNNISSPSIPEGLMLIREP